MSKHAHRYSVTICPDCGHDLTTPIHNATAGVMIEARGNGGEELGRHKCRLDSTGLLVDNSGIVGAGFHAGTFCFGCDEPLDDYET